MSHASEHHQPSNTHPSWMGRQADVQIELRSDPRFLSGARELVAAISRRLGFDETTCCQIALAVDEALANIICHGYERREDGRIWLYLWPIDGGGLRVLIEDEGRQVDIDQIKSRELDDIRPGGLGVHIIKEVMDEAIYEKRERVGMRLTLTKRVQPVAARSSGEEPCDA